MAKTQTKWENVVKNPDDYEGFVYLIINTINDRKYIGRKFTKKRNRIKLSETSKRRKLVISESDWYYYKSSSDELKADIAKYGQDSFRFIILEWCKTRKDAMYLEVEYQVKNDVLTKKLDTGDYEFYNSNIMSRYFRPKEAGTIEYETKCRNISTSLKDGFSSGRIVHPMKGKQHPNRGKKLPQTGIKNKGRYIGHICYTDGTRNLFLPKSKKPPTDFKRGITRVKVDQIAKFKKLYSENLKYCKACGVELSYENRKRTYCGTECQQTTHSSRMHDHHSSTPLINPFIVGMYITPYGKFLSSIKAANAEKSTAYKIKRKCKLKTDGYEFIPLKEIPKEWLNECL